VAQELDIASADTRDSFTAANSTYWVIGFAAGVLLALSSRGLAGDEEALHYLLARHALHHPENWIGLAGRPLVTLILTLPAQAGLLGARLAAAAATGFAAAAVARAARHTGAPAPVWAVLLFLLQPFLLAHCGTAMTEPWAAALLAWGLVAIAERRPRLLAAIAAALPLVRTELVVFWPLAAVLIWRQRRRTALMWLPVPLLLWNALGAMASGDPLWLPHHLAGPAYSLREPLHYVRSLAWVLGPGILVPVVVGVADRIAREGARRKAEIQERGAGRRAELGALAMLLTLLALYTALASGGPGTGGNLRYLAMASPAAALLASVGLRALISTRHRAAGIGLALALAGTLTLWRHPYHREQLALTRTDLFAFAAAVAWTIAYALPRRLRVALPALAVALAALGLVRDHRTFVLRSPTAEERAISDAAQWLRARSGTDAEAIFAAHPLLAMNLGRDPYDRVDFPPFRAMDAAPRGALVFWDSHYAVVQAPHPSDQAAGSKFRPTSAPLPDSTWSFLAGFAASDTTWAGAFFTRGDSADAPTEAGWLTLYRSASTGVAYARAAVAADPLDPARWRELAQRLAMAGRIEEARAAARTARRIRETASSPGAVVRDDSAAGPGTNASAP
jgi:hypothetical protein